MENLEIFYCPACGANDWLQTGNKISKCSYCGTKFQSNVLQSEVDLVSIIETQFGKQKLEMYRNAKVELWKVTHEEYLSNINIKTWCNEVKKYSPKDALAIFYSVATFDGINSVSNYLCEYMRKEEFTYAEEIVRYLLKTADNKRIITLLYGVIEKACLSDEYSEQVKELSQKLIDGVFVTTAPRDVFILYSSKDIAIVTEIVDYIEYNGFKCFIANRNLRHGKGAKEKYVPELKTAMHNSKVMVFVSSENSRDLDCDAIKEEIPYLKEFEVNKKRIEYVIDKEKYVDTVPVVEDILKEYFAGQEWCTDKRDLVKHIFDGVKGFKEINNESNEVSIYTQVQPVVNDETKSLLRRVFDFLGDKEWEKADEYCEKILDRDVENGEAYLGKLMAKLKVIKREELQDLEEPIEGERNYKKIEQYGSEELKKEVRGYNKEIKRKLEEKNNEDIYKEAVRMKNSSRTEDEFKKATRKFEDIKGYKDSNRLIKECLEKGEECRKNIIYELGILELKKDTREGYEKAISIIKGISGYKDTDKLIEKSKIRITEIKKKEEEEKKKAEEIEKKYRDAVSVENKATTIEDYNETIAKYKEIGRYKDTEERIKKCEERVETLRNPQKNNISVGDIIKFGRYPQCKNAEVKEIEWRVLDNKNGELFLLSEYCLDCKKYNEKWTAVTWETCTLRKWLNNDFYNKAFNSEEQTRILTTKVTADKNPNYSTAQGSDTNDKVFLLSIKEVNQYFKDNNSMIAKPTEYAKSRGSYVNDSTGGAWWWLRSAGDYSDIATRVYSFGGVSYYGDYVYNLDGSARVALKIHL